MEKLASTYEYTKCHKPEDQQRHEQMDIIIQAVTFCFLKFLTIKYARQGIHDVTVGMSALLLSLCFQFVNLNFLYFLINMNKDLKHRNKSDARVMRRHA
jgi:hypothetical protein